MDDDSGGEINLRLFRSNEKMAFIAFEKQNSSFR